MPYFQREREGNYCLTSYWSAQGRLSIMHLLVLTNARTNYIVSTTEICIPKKIYLLKE